VNKKQLITTLSLTIILFSSTTTAAEPRTERYAIIIGISDYQTINDLDLSDDDALAMRDALDAISWNHITTLTDQQASKTGIRDAITALIGVTDHDDIVLFYFAGHGTYDTDIAPLDEDDGMDEYICPWDSSTGYTTNIRDDELQAWLDNLPCRKVVILDTCFSGGFIREEVMTARTLPGKPRTDLTDTFARDLDKAGYVVLTACRDDELSYESSALGHGVFTYFLLHGMEPPDLPADADQDTWVTAEELYYHATPGTTTYSPTQHPQLHDHDPANDVRIGLCRIVGGEIQPPDTTAVAAVVAGRTAIALFTLAVIAVTLRIRKTL
jgi:uncharacterized caspase-like protein